MGNGVGMEKAPPTGNPRPRPCFHLSGDGDENVDDFGGGEGTRNHSPVPSRTVVIHTHQFV